VTTKIHPELTFWLSPVESVLSFASNGVQFFLQSASSATNCPSRSPANPFSHLKEETLPQLENIATYLRAHAQELGDRILEPTRRKPMAVHNGPARLGIVADSGAGRVWGWYAV
jgi:hypothetical protein